MHTKRPSRQLRRRTRVLMEAVEPRLLLATDVLSYHGSDLTDSGVNPTEIQLTPGNITTATFGKQFTTDVRDTPNNTGLPNYELPSGTDYTSPSGQIYAQPLVKTGVNITTGQFQGIHDVVFVATAMNSLFAIDANGGTVLWKDSFIYNASGNPNPLNANLPAGVTAVPGGAGTEINTPDVAPWIGIISTPVIDPSSGYIYLTAKTREVKNGDQKNPHYVYTLHKIRMSDGLDTSVVIGDTTLGYSNPGAPTYTYNSGPYVLGTGDGAINVSGQSRIYFNAVRQMNRPALIINNGRIYIEFASHGDNQPYHGWILTYDPATLAINGAFNTTPNSDEGEAGIWQGGGYGTFDSNGNLYVETGNGKFDGSNGANHAGAITGLDANGFPVNGDYGDSFLKIAVDSTTTQGNQGSNKNGWGLKVLDYFSPYNNLDLDSADRDLGSGGPIILTGVMSPTNHPLLVGSGKEGKIYVIDTGAMGKFGNSDNIVQTIGSAINGSLDTPAFFNGRLYYTSAYGGPGISWQVVNGKINTSSNVQTTPDQFVFPGSSPMITANGTLNGIAWMIDRNGQLRAYDAANLSNEIWTSSQNASRDGLGSAVKFAVATPVNGRVYAGTSGFLLSYGPPIPPTSGPLAPTNLVASATGAATIQLTWKDNSNNEDGFKIERSSDGQHFSEVGTAGANQTSFVDSNLSAQVTYYYQVRAYNSFNSLSYSAYTTIASATTLASGLQAPVDLYSFDEGAGTSTADGVGTNKGTLSGTTPPTWVSGRVGSGALSFSGTGAYEQNGQSAVTLSNNLAPVLGSTSSLAFWIKTTQVGSNVSYMAPAITGVDQGPGTNDIGWGIIDASGHIGMFVGDSGKVLSTVSINNGQWHHVALSRDASNGQVKIYIDGVLNQTATFETGNKTSSFAALGELTDVGADGVAVLGGNFFNGQLDDVRIYNQLITPAEVSGLALAPATPTNLVVKPASGTELDLTWNDAATSETGYKVERSINGGPFTQIQLLPANSTSYDDEGLLQNTPYSYRVRATSSAGDSGYSNTVNITTPIAPVTPTNAQTTLVASNQINLKWSDNAGNEDGYKVLRRIGENQFAQIADLPPNTTTYQDKTGLAPNVSYDYHIQAYNIAGYSDFTGLTVDTLAATPTGVSLVTAPGSITVSWSAATGADSYNVYRGTSPGGEGAVPFATGITTTNFVDNSVSGGQFYYYQITSLNDSDVESPRSAEATNSTVQAPTANPDSATTNQNQPVSINVLGNDTASTGTIDPTSVVITTTAGHGTLSVNPTTGVVTYTPASNFTGPDQFYYTVKDSLGNVSSPALVTLTVNSTQPVYVSSLTPTSATNGWGPYEKNTSNGENAAGDGHTITLNGVQYQKGLGVHANSDISFNLVGGNYTEFDSDIGVDDEVTANSTIIFKVYLDGSSTPIYTSPVMTPTTATITIPAINVTGASTLRLVVSDAGDGNTSDHGDWANARLLQGTPVSPPPASPPPASPPPASPPPASPPPASPPPASPPPPPTTVYVSSLTPTSATNGWGPYEKNTSNGENAAGDGHTITLNGVQYQKGLGVHANSDISFNLVGGNYTEFDSDIGVDDEVVASSTIVFQVYVDGVMKYASPVMTPTTATISIPAVSLVGASTLRLVVTDAGDGNTSDHGDWANARLLQGTAVSPPPASPPPASPPPASPPPASPPPPPGTTTYVSELPYTVTANGWGPVEKNHSNGENNAGDGHTITLNTQTYTEGLGVHANSDVSVALNGQYTEFDSDIGVDDEVGSNGSVIFQIYVDGVQKYASPVMTGASTTISIPAIDVTGATTLRLVVTDAGINGNTSDHADWANARLLSGPVTPPAAPSGLTAAYNNSTGKIDLNWVDASSNETGFRVERKLGAAGTWAALTTLPAGAQSYSDPGPFASSSTYYYRVFSFIGSTDSTSSSNEFPIDTPVISVQTWLSDLTWVSATSGWGPIEKNTSNGENNAGDGGPISIRGNTYAKGLGVHANSDITYNIGGLYKTFNTDIGIDNEVAPNGSVDFKIYLDGAANPIYDSGIVRGTDAVKSVSLNVTGVQTLRLVVTDGGDGIGSDHADWAGAQLLG